MTQQKQYIANVPKLYKFQSLELIAFGYVQALRFAFPSLTIQQAMTEFLKNFGFEEDEYPLIRACEGYRRVLVSLVEIQDGYVGDVENIIL